MAIKDFDASQLTFTGHNANESNTATMSKTQQAADPSVLSALSNPGFTTKGVGGNKMGGGSTINGILDSLMGGDIDGLINLGMGTVGSLVQGTNEFITTNMNWAAGASFVTSFLPQLTGNPTTSNNSNSGVLGNIINMFGGNNNNNNNQSAAQTHTSVQPIAEPVQQTIPFSDEESSLGADAGDLMFYIPKYGVADFLNDRIKWQRQLYNMAGEPGWFYFKIFFKFNTEYGLFGGMFKNGGKYIRSTNSALGFLNGARKYYSTANIDDRIRALQKFCSTFKSMAVDTPWMFKGVGGIDQLPGAYTKEQTKEKTLDITLNEETADMRIGTMFDLYKYACYDNIYCREILPANLRKFDMAVMLYQLPIKKYQTAGATLPYITPMNKNKTTIPINTARGDMMSFKLYSFMNCEFDETTLNVWNGSSMNNETAFKQGATTFKIKYDRFYEMRMNEWARFLMSDEGIYWNESELYMSNLPLEVIPNGRKDNSWNKRLLEILGAKELGTPYYEYADMIRYQTLHSEFTWENNNIVNNINSLGANVISDIGQSALGNYRGAGTGSGANVGNPNGGGFIGGIKMGK